MTTSYVNCAPSDPLALHDVYRVTLTAPSHFYETSGADADWFATGVRLLYDGTVFQDAPTLGGVVPTTPNPVQPGDLAAVIDFLVASTNAGTLADFLTQLHHATSMSLLGGLAGESLTETAKVERIVGAGAVPPGTPAAADATDSFAAGVARTTAQQEASAAAKTAGSWLTDIENSLGTAGKYLVLGVGLFGAYWLWKESRKL